MFDEGKYSGTLLAICALLLSNAEIQLAHIWSLCDVAIGYMYGDFYQSIPFCERKDRYHRGSSSRETSD